MKLFFAILFFTVSSFEVAAQNYDCEKLKSDETTRRSYFETVTFQEKKSFRIVKGIAQINGKSIADVFVEVFADENPNRIDGCKTGANGRFSFPGLKKGNYTLRLSKDGGYELTEIKIEVSPRSKNRRDIIGQIEVGK